MSVKKNIAITYLRAMAAVSIFICHILFISGFFKTSMWFNTGVPIFFIISGFLMSQKQVVLDTAGVAKFYKSRIQKLYLPYAIYVSIVSAVLFLIRKPPDAAAFFLYLFGAAGFSPKSILGLGHLWFMSVLVICYLLTPFFQWGWEERNKKTRLAILWIVLIVQFIVFIWAGYPSYGVHIGCYTFAYFTCRGAGWTRGKKECICWGIAALVFSAVRLVMDPIFMAADSAIYYYYDALFQPLARFILAMWIFQMMLAGTERIEKWARSHCRLNYCMQVLSESSFEIYLTHQFIQLSVWEFLPYKNLWGRAIWVILSVFPTAVNTQMLKIICSAIKKCCKRRLN